MKSEAMKLLVTHPQTLKIPINWKKESSNFNTYKRWIELWEID
jgi:Restriction endonuclease ThaI